MISSRRLAVGCLIMITTSIFLWQESAQACAMCQTVLPRGDDPLARGLFWSVLILLTAPFAVSAVIGGWVYYHYRKSAGTRRE